MHLDALSIAEQADLLEEVKVLAAVFGKLIFPVRSRVVSAACLGAAFTVYRFQISVFLQCVNLFSLRFNCFQEVLFGLGVKLACVSEHITIFGATFNYVDG